MKQTVITFLSLILISTISFAQKAPASPKMTTESENVSITYGQPSKNGREVFGKLVPFGEVWRTGANDGTQVTFKKDVKVAGKKVKAGTYTMFTIPNSGEWTVILNSELKQWGSYGYAKIKDKNVAEVMVKSMNNKSTVEKLTITASDSQISIEWDNTIVNVPLSW